MIHAKLRKRWIAQVTINIADDEELLALAAKAGSVTARYPDKAEPLIWQGIILSTWAGAKGGLGALSLAKESRKQLEAAIAIDPDALQGSAYTSLGTLYFKVPGWPIGFGDTAKAKELLQQALTINPEGIDPNFFYGEFLLEEDRYAESVAALNKALQAAPRPDRPIADAGRKAEIQATLAEARKQLQWADGYLATHDYPKAYLHAHRAMRPLRLLGRAEWEAARVRLLESFRQRTRRTLKILLVTYVGLTASETALLLVCGMGPFDAVTHAFATIATGGFSTSDGSIGHFDSAAVDIVTTIFMIIGSLPFLLYFQAAR